MKRHLIFGLVLLLSLAFSACIKRIPAAAGPDRALRAGEEIVLGQEAELPEGTSIVWDLGDGRSLPGALVQAVWDRPGRYQVRVQVRDADGEQRSDGAQFEVVRPPLIEVLPGDCGYLVLFDTPPAGLGGLPLFLERLLASGQDVNRVLAAIREGFGFDPLTPEGMAAAGFDPAGSLALAGLASGRDPVMLASLLPGAAVEETVRTTLARRGEYKEQANTSDAAVIEVRSLDKGDLRLAYTYFRGHLWLAAPGPADSDPIRTLLDLRRRPAANHLAANADYERVLARQPAPGAVHLYMTPAFMRQAQRAGQAGASDAERRTQEAILDRLAGLRADVDFADDGLRVLVRVGLQGEEFEALRQVFRSQRPLPAFRSMIADGQHLVVKASVDGMKLVEQILSLAGETRKWNELRESLDQLAARSGVPLYKGLLENLGDAWLLTARFNLAGLPGLAAEGGQGKPKLEDLLEGVILIEVLDGELLRRTLDGLAGLASGADRIVAFEEQGRRFWRLGPAGTGLALGVEGRMAAVASSARVAAAALARAAKPGPADARWPASMDRPEVQLAALDLERLFDDFGKVQVPVDNPTAALIKGMVAMNLRRIGQVEQLVLEAVLERDELVLSLRLGLKK